MPGPRPQSKQSDQTGTNLLLYISTSPATSNQRGLDNNNAWRYYWVMIKSFAGRNTERLFNNVFVPRFSGFERAARRKLLILHGAEQLTDLMVPPRERLEKLVGNRKRQYSIRINDQWRICFSWKGTDAFDVEIVDYH